jgi:hypothetical protein
MLDAWDRMPDALPDAELSISAKCRRLIISQLLDIGSGQPIFAGKFIDAANYR